MSVQTPVGGRPTRRQLETLVVYIEAGSIAAAAHELGIAETTVRQHLSGLYHRTGCLNATQAAYRLGRAELAESRGGAKAASASDRRLTRGDDRVCSVMVAGPFVTQETDGRSRAAGRSRGPVP
jgi:DNA-binding CsgD family transcriptional regulator